LFSNQCFLVRPPVGTHHYHSHQFSATSFGGHLLTKDMKQLRFLHRPSSGLCLNLMSRVRHQSHIIRQTFVRIRSEVGIQRETTIAGRPRRRRTLRNTQQHIHHHQNLFAEVLRRRTRTIVSSLHCRFKHRRDLEYHHLIRIHSNTLRTWGGRHRRRLLPCIQWGIPHQGTTGEEGGGLLHRWTSRWSQSSSSGSTRRTTYYAEGEGQQTGTLAI